MMRTINSYFKTQATKKGEAITDLQIIKDNLYQIVETTQYDEKRLNDFLLQQVQGLNYVIGQLGG